MASNAPILNTRSPELAQTLDMNLTSSSAPLTPSVNEGPSPSIATMMPFEPLSSGAGVSSSGTNQRRNPRKSRMWRRVELATLPNSVTPSTSYYKLNLNNARFSIKESVEVMKELQATAGICREDVSETKDGSLLIKAKSPEQAQKLDSINTLGGKTVSSAPDPVLNSCQGTIYAPGLISLSEEEIKSFLEEWKVTRVHRFLNRASGQPIPTPRLLLTFGTLIPPEEVWFAWHRFSVRLYIPAPMRCYGCHKFGHTITHCRQPSKLCAICGETVHEGSPCLRPRCINCDGPHSATSTGCPVFSFEKEVIHRKTTERLTFPQARAKVLKDFSRDSPSFAEVLKRRRGQQPRPQQSAMGAEAPAPSPKGGRFDVLRDLSFSPESESEDMEWSGPSKDMKRKRNQSPPWAPKGKLPNTGSIKPHQPGSLQSVVSAHPSGESPVTSVGVMADSAGESTRETKRITPSITRHVVPAQRSEGSSASPVGELEDAVGESSRETISVPKQIPQPILRPVVPVQRSRGSPVSPVGEMEDTTGLSAGEKTSASKSSKNIITSKLPKLKKDNLTKSQLKLNISQKTPIVPPKSDG